VLKGWQESREYTSRGRERRLGRRVTRMDNQGRPARSSDEVAAGHPAEEDSRGQDVEEHCRRGDGRPKLPAFGCGLTLGVCEGGPVCVVARGRWTMAMRWNASTPPVIMTDRRLGVTLRRILGMGPKTGVTSTEVGARIWARVLASTVLGGGKVRALG
jgi:hypothetical protein